MLIGISFLINRKQIILTGHDQWGSFIVNDLINSLVNGPEKSQEFIFSFPCCRCVTVLGIYRTFMIQVLFLEIPSNPVLQTVWREVLNINRCNTVIGSFKKCNMFRLDLENIKLPFA